MSLVGNITLAFQAVAAQVKALSARVPPSGGTTGQVLTKSSPTSYDVQWTTPAAGGLAAGRPGQVLRTAADGSTIEFEEDLGRCAVVAGSYYAPDTLLAGNSAASAAANTLYALPFFRGGKFDAIALYISALASGSARFGLYACTAQGLPGALIEESTASAQVSTGSAGVKVSTFAAARKLTQPAWLVAVFSGAPGIQVGSNVATNRASAMLGQPNPTGAVSTLITGLAASYSYAALPSDLSTTTFTTQSGSLLPYLCLRGSA